ncbi:uncharacterized protein [Polyergus mexicanus]|uniref:uncharacterized protein isoform X2 n=1 Tax=Polyergus mexicanus TaxID=615972 RepID=UPI0038B49367
MNPPSRRSTRENAINEETTDTIVATKSKFESKSAVISHDYEAAISQPDIPASKIDSNTRNPSWSDSSDGLSAPIKKRSLYTRGKVNVTTKKRGIVFKSKIQTKKITKIHPQQISNVVEIEKESISSSEITRDTEDFGKGKIDAVTLTLNHHEKNLVHSRDIQEPLEIAENDKNFMNVAIHASQGNSYDETSKKIDKNAKLYISQNSKIPRIKPNSYSSAYEESHVYSNRKVPVRNKLQCSINMKSSTECSEEINEFKVLKKETLKIADHEKVNTKNILQTVQENSMNIWYPEKSSEMDADEEFEEDSPTTESPIITDHDPRSATLSKSLALKCDCHTSRCIETESWSSSETNRWKKDSIVTTILLSS